MGLPEPPALGAAALPAGTFAGSTVLVTGGGTGLGKAMAVEFARLGARLVLASRSADHLEAGARAVEGATTVICDVRSPEAVAAAFDAAGEVDVLINNAAGTFPVAAEDLSPNGFRSVVDIVLHGTFVCSREFARRRIDSGRGGVILNIGASYAWTGGPGFVHSAAGKAGVKNLTETLAVEWAPYGIRVNCLVPGLFPHDDEAGAIQAVPGRDASTDESTAPAGRAGRAHELGWAATFLASPYASYISGATLTVDGANWQRRSMVQPPFTPIRDQLAF